MTTTGKSFLAHLSEAEENGYQGTYFTSQPSHSPTFLGEGYISSTSPVDFRNPRRPSDTIIPVVTDVDPGAETDPGLWKPAESPPKMTPMAIDVDPGAETDPGLYTIWKPTDDIQTPEILPPTRIEEDVAEVVFFEFGVVVFFGLEERQEKDILEDIANAGIVKRPIGEDDWEIEECHFAVCFLS